MRDVAEQLRCLTQLGLFERDQLTGVDRVLPRSNELIDARDLR
jgi:hypothetical protein